MIATDSDEEGWGVTDSSQLFSQLPTPASQCSQSQDSQPEFLSTQAHTMKNMLEGLAIPASWGDAAQGEEKEKEGETFDQMTTDIASRVACFDRELDSSQVLYDRFDEAWSASCSNNTLKF